MGDNWRQKKKRLDKKERKGKKPEFMPAKLQKSAWGSQKEERCPENGPRRSQCQTKNINEQA